MKNRKIKKSNKIINLFSIPEKQYSFRANVVNSFDIYSQETQIIHISNMKVCINGIWMRVRNSRQLSLCLDDKLQKLDLKNGDVIEFNAILASVNQTFGEIQQKNGSIVKIPYYNSQGYLPIDYNGNITIKNWETLNKHKTKEKKYCSYIIELNRKSFNKEKDKFLKPDFLAPTKRNDGYYICVEEISFIDKRIDVLGGYKKLSSNSD